MKISAQTYARALADALKDVPDPTAVIKSTLLVLQKRKQLKLLPKILAAFENEWNNRNYIVKMHVLYPKNFAQSVDAFVAACGQKVKKEIIVESRPSDELIGGFKVIIGETVLDGSVQGQLKALKSGLGIKN